MPDVNLTLLVGRAGRDAELKTVSGREVASFTLATHRVFRRGSGELEKRTDWHDVDIWGPLAKGAAAHIRAGKLVAIRGEHRTRLVEHSGKSFRVSTVAADWFNTAPETPPSDEEEAPAAEDATPVEEGAPA